MKQIVLFFLVCLLMSALLIVAVSVYAGYEQKPDPDGTFKRLLLRQNKFSEEVQYTEKDVELIVSYPRLPYMNDSFDFEPGPQLWVSLDYSKAAIFWFSKMETPGEWSCYQVETLWDHKGEEK